MFNAEKALPSFIYHWEGRRNKEWARYSQSLPFQRLSFYIIRKYNFALAMHLMRGSALMNACILPSHSW